MMKVKFFLALLLVSLLAVFLCPTAAVLAAPQDPVEQPAAAQSAAPSAPSPVVQIVIGLVMLLFACLAFAPLAPRENCYN